MAPATNPEILEVSRVQSLGAAQNTSHFVFKGFSERVFSNKRINLAPDNSNQEINNSISLSPLKSTDQTYQSTNSDLKYNHTNGHSALDKLAGDNLTTSFTEHRSDTFLNRSTYESIVHLREEAIKRGIFFRKLTADFGKTYVGSLNRQKIELCNSTDKEVLIFVGDPALPFVVLHNEIHLKPKSFVRIPVRFVPIAGILSITKSTSRS